MKSLSSGLIAFPLVAIDEARGGRMSVNNIVSEFITGLKLELGRILPVAYYRFVKDSS